MTEFHVRPRNDLIDHEMSEDCVCGPEWLQESGNDVYVHHSLDGREKDE